MSPRSITHRNHVRALRRVCSEAGWREEASQGTYTVHRLGRQVHLRYKEGRWHLDQCPTTGCASVTVPATSPRALLPDLADRLTALSRIRTSAA